MKKRTLDLMINPKIKAIPEMKTTTKKGEGVFPLKVNTHIIIFRGGAMHL